MEKFIKYSKCCSVLTGPSGQPTDCVESWAEDLKNVTNLYDAVAAEADMAWAAYTNASGWKEKLKLWLSNLDKANDSALDISTELEAFIAQVNITCTNTDLTANAIKVLLCDIKAIFDSFYTYPAQTGLKEQVAELRKQVECLTDIDEAEKTDILKCIETYDIQIKAVCALQNDLLKKLVEMYKCINLLYAAVCGTDGLLTNLETLYEAFPTELPKPNPNLPPAPDPGQVGSQLFPCDPDVAKPKPEIPIEQGAFYTTMSAECNLAQEEVEKLKKIWEEKRKERDKLLARKNSLMEAIKAAGAAESGK